MSPCTTLVAVQLEIGETLLASAEAVRVAWRWNAGDRLALALPLFHLHGLGVGLHGTLLAGASAVLVGQFEPSAVVRAINDHDASLFFGVVYAGGWPVPLPLPTSFGGAQSYIDQLKVQLDSCDPTMLIYPPEIGAMCAEAARIAGTEGIDWSEFVTRDAPEAVSAAAIWP